MTVERKASRRFAAAALVRQEKILGEVLEELYARLRHDEAKRAPPSRPGIVTPDVRRGHLEPLADKGDEIVLCGGSQGVRHVSGRFCGLDLRVVESHWHNQPPPDVGGYKEVDRNAPESHDNRCPYVLTNPLQLPLSIRALLAVCAASFCTSGLAKGASPFQTNDVVAFLGGADVVAAQHSGHLESLLAIGCRGMGVRFRNFGWEGDTVFEQPRDFGFPSVTSRVQKAGATVIVVQFGRGEALNGRGPGFEAAYRKFVDGLAPHWPRLILVTPIPFENGGGLLPDLSKHNTELASNAGAIRKVAAERQLMLVDLFRELSGGQRLTSDGLQLTPGAHGIVAAAFPAQLGFPGIAKKAGGTDDAGKWKNSGFEQARQEVIAKNRLWFDYSRPQNWAFLGGDRITQPSSHDHRNPKVRWFPGEIEKFLPLIAAAEAKIDTAAGNAITK